MPDRDPVLLAKRLHRTFVSGHWPTKALDDVSIDCFAGESALIMGPSGSGKSTLLSVLSGLSVPDRGQVVAHGTELTRLSAAERKRFRLRHCGFVFQGHNLFPALTAREQLELVLLWGEGFTPKEARREADAMLDLLGLRKQTRLLPAELSGGEKQRVAIGRALIKKPTLCFADEPTSALDWERGKRVVDLLRDVAKRDRATVIVVSHDARVRPFMDRTYHMEDGKLLNSPCAPTLASCVAGDVDHASGN